MDTAFDLQWATLLRTRDSDSIFVSGQMGHERECISERANSRLYHIGI